MNILYLFKYFTIISLLAIIIEDSFSQEILIESEAGIIIGNTDETNQKPGTIRWTGLDFEGWNGLEWLSLTGKELSNGDLFVTVTDIGYTPLSGVNVYTNPISVGGVTDEFGSVLLRGLPTGSYEVFGSTNTGAGKTVVNISQDDLQQVNVFLINGSQIGLTPTIDLILPDLPGEYATNEAIPFSADFSDDNTPSSELLIEWESDLDGVFNSDSPQPNGNSSFIDMLSSGIHQITLTATNNDGYSSTITFQINTQSPQAIVLDPLMKNANDIELSWQKYTGVDFSKYDIFRGNSDCNPNDVELIASFSNIDSISFIDSTAPLEFVACYFVRVTNNSGNTRNSNIEAINFPSGVVFSFVPHDFTVHPTMSWLYLLDQGGQKLVKYNYDLEEIIEELNLESTIGYFDIGDNGFGYELYLPADDGQVYIYDADNLDFVTAINTGLSTPSTVTNGNGYIAASVRPSPWWEMPIRTYNRMSGINISGNGGFEGDRLRMIPGKDEIISISTSVSPIDMEYLELDSDGTILQHVDDTYHGDHPLDPTIFRISPMGTYSITSNQGALYTANESMEYRGILQRGSLQYSDFAFSDDDQTIYAGTSNRKSIQIGSSQSLLRSGEILTKGYPHLIEKKGTQLILVSKSSEFSSTTGVELISIGN